MKKLLSFLIMSLLLSGVLEVLAQSGCDLYITSDFDSECLLTEYYKEDTNMLSMGIEDCVLACKGNTVQYTAVCPNGVQYFWTVSGAASYHPTSQGNSIVVNWGFDNTGSVSVNVVTADSNTCSAELCVLLIESPTVGSSTVPLAYLQGEQRIIEVCRGETITMTDTSTAGQTPITGYFWNTPFGNASTQNHSVVATQSGTFTFTHSVQNECGCESTEQYIVKVTEPVKLNLSCYGTVCEGTQATYTLMDPPCSKYMWNVEGGSIVSNPNSSTIVVDWGSPSCGYGVISIDASFCDTECDALTSIQIPVITNHTEIKGPDTVCLGDVQIYELPVWGSTSYWWQIDDGNAVTLSNTDLVNQALLTFNQTGPYVLTVNYECSTIDCGEFSSSKTIIVKDTMSIFSHDSVLCAGETGLYGTYHNNPVTWRVYRQNNQLLYSTTAVSLSYTFASSGNYKIVASNSNYCKDAEFLVTVLAPPPALSTVQGPSDACPGSSILLQGTPTHPSYYLEWMPVCSTATPSFVTGEEATISYGNSVCDVAVYQVDNEYNCRSTAYIHTVASFSLAASGLPSDTTVCAGTTFNMSVPYQANVVYEWTILPANAATVEVNHLANNVNIMVNHQSITPPYTATLRLKRTYCTNSEDYVDVTLHIEDVATPTASCTTPICVGDIASFWVTSPISSPSHYTWQVDNTTLIGNTVTHSFNQAGNFPYSLYYQPIAACPAVVVSGNIEVVSAPVVAPYIDGSYVCVLEYPNATYSWTFNGDPWPSISGHDNMCDQSNVDGIYCCTVSFNTLSNCSASGCVEISHDGNNCLDLTGTLIPGCNDPEITLDSHPNGTVTWSVSPDISGNYHSGGDIGVTMHFVYPGVYSVNADMIVGNQCYQGVFPVTIDCVPNFTLSYNCTDHVTFTDKSLYRMNGLVVSRTLTIPGYAGSPITINSSNLQIPKNYFQIGVPNQVTLTITLSSGEVCEITKSFTIANPPSITSLNVPQNMCEETPFYFSAIADGISFRWDFGDHSYFNNNGVYHTYDLTQQWYNAVFTAINADGCVIKDSVSINVVQNILKSGYISSPGPVVCAGTLRALFYTPNSTYNSYYWNNSTTPGTNTYYVNHTGDYNVLVVSSANGCMAEKMINVGFLNTPTAKITGNTEYCFGEEVKLNGNTGSLNTYSWTVNGPSSIAPSSNPIFTCTPTQSGSYQATLVVTNQTCSASTSTNFTIHPQLPAPSIAFNGNACIHNPPVYLHSTNSQNLLWSNGYYGTDALYYTDGFVSAYYLDPTTGCPSETEYLFIEPAPDYSALLTGCYEKCEDELPFVLPYYGFYPYQPSGVHWSWMYGNTLVDSATSIYPYLNVANFGSYHLESSYGNGCNSASPSLTISKVDVCACDSISVKVKKGCFVENCRLYYTMTVTVRNNSSQAVYFDQFYTNSSSVILDVNSFIPIALNPGESHTVHFKIVFTDFESGCVTFTLYDSERECEKTFTECFDWSKCVKMAGCDIVKWEPKFNQEISTPHQTSYFDFSVILPSSVSDVVAVWSDPSQVISYSYYPPSSVSGLLMLNYAQLTQLAAHDDKICINVIMCIDGSYLCYSKFCIKAKIFLELVPEEFRQLPDSTTADNDTTRSFQSSSFVPQADKPYLAPNPARDEVTVMGIAPEEVAEITVLTMQGGQVAEFRNDYRFNVSRLAKASYIVRVITTDRQVHYLKLVKQ